MDERPKPRDAALDLLRICAAVLVVFHHYQQLTGARFTGFPNFFDGRLYVGYVVELFFIISGYLMLPYVQRLMDGMRFRNFMGRRAVRLVPLTTVCSVAYFVLHVTYSRIYGMRFFGIEVSLWHVVADALCIQIGWVGDSWVNTPTWYVSVLVLCYVVLYLACWVARRLKTRPWGLFWFLVLLGVGIMSYGIRLPFLNEHSGRGFYAFFWGLLLHKGFDWVESRPEELHRRIERRLYPTATAAVAVIGWMTWRHWWVVIWDYQYLYTFLLYPSLMLVTHWALRGRESKALACLAGASFDTYLWHYPLVILMYVVMGLTGWQSPIGTPQMMFAFTACSVLVGMVSYRFLELPLGRWATKAVRELLAS